MRFFVADGLRRAAPRPQLVAATPVTAGCRMLKSAAELALMQRASDITIPAFKAAFATLREGMTQYDLCGQHDGRAHAGSAAATPGRWWASASPPPFRTAASSRSGSSEGDIVLLDAGCAVRGLPVRHHAHDRLRPADPAADRDLEPGAKGPGRRVRRGAGGRPCEAVDAAARKVITDAGLRSRLPGARACRIAPATASASTATSGPNFVRGNTTPLAPGMCFSDEPTIAIYGEFGIRLEDCLYITEDGPRFFSPQSLAIDRPLA